MRSWRVAWHSIDEIPLAIKFLLRPLSNVSTKRTASFIAKNRVWTSGHEHSKQAINDAAARLLILNAPHVGLVQAQGEGGADIKAEEVLVDCLEIGIDFLHLVYHIVHVTFGKLLDFVIG